MSSIALQLARYVELETRTRRISPVTVLFPFHVASLAFASAFTDDFLSV